MPATLKSIESHHMKTVAANSDLNREVLIATAYGHELGMLGKHAVIVDSAKECLELGARGTFKCIFVDETPLRGEEQITECVEKSRQLAAGGYRLVAELRNQNVRCRIFIITGAKLIFRDEFWAKRWGATGILQRTPADIIKMIAEDVDLPASLPTDARARPAETAIIMDTPAKVEAFTKTLREYIGPAADFVVEQTLGNISRRHNNRVSVEALASAVSMHIEREKVDRFLSAAKKAVA